MCKSTEEVVKRFATRKTNRRSGLIEWSAARVFCDEKVIYSYGHHFPMAKYLGEVNGQPLFIKNGDRYSSSTSGHQSDVQRHCKGPTVARSAIGSAGFEFTRITLDNILDFRPDLREHLYRDTETGKFYKKCDRYGEGAERLKQAVFSEPYAKPKQGQWIPYEQDEDDKAQKVESGVWHCLGAVVLTKDDEYYLASLDEGQYFVAQLPGKPENVKDAFTLLQPVDVQRAFRRKLDVKRQGEWFFVPTGLSTNDFRAKIGLTKKAFDRIVKVVPLPERPLPAHRPAFDRQRNRHVCRQYFIVDEGIYVNGFVRHKGADNRATREHRTLNLGDQWHKAYINTEVASWTVGGRFD